MTLITLQDGKIVLRDGKVGTEQACCCDQGCCAQVMWHRVHGECSNLPDDYLDFDVDEDCYAYYVFEDWDCENPLVGRDCGDGGEYGQCNVYARVKVTGNTAGSIEYLQNEPGDDGADVWASSAPGGRCACPDAFGSLSVECKQCECTNCDIEVTVEVESETLSLNANDTWLEFVQLCFDDGGGESSASSRSVRAKAYCGEDGKVNVVVEIGWAAAGYCARIITYTYSFQSCDTEGCASGGATLISTDDTGEVDDFFGNCDDPFVNRACNQITAPSAVTANPLP